MSKIWLREVPIITLNSRKRISNKNSENLITRNLPEEEIKIDLIKKSLRKKKEFPKAKEEKKKKKLQEEKKEKNL